MTNRVMLYIVGFGTRTNGAGMKKLTHFVIASRENNKYYLNFKHVIRIGWSSYLLPKLV